MFPETYDEIYHLRIVVTLTIGFSLATILGYLSLRTKLSPLLGYLVAGYIIGPFFPGFVADSKLAEQLAEVGVMLMLFSVGLHFKWQDLVGVKNIAIPGAIGQTVIASVATAILVHSLGWSWEKGLIMGVSIGVASTVVMVRVLSDYHLLATLQGHIAIGWLIVEDILTVIALILLPILYEISEESSISFQKIVQEVLLILLKFSVLVVLMLTVGRRIASLVLLKIVKTHSDELFTLTVLTLIFLIATCSSFIFGTSIALGAFLAGMVIGQTDLKHQASIHSSPMKDAFTVIFFLSVGMLFNPVAIIHNLVLFFSALFVVLVIKPLTAFFIVRWFRYSKSIALIIAFALAQVGEFSFILAEEAFYLEIVPHEVYDVIVACALISISINPLLFKLLDSRGLLVGENTNIPTTIPSHL